MINCKVKIRGSGLINCYNSITFSRCVCFMGRCFWCFWAWDFWKRHPAPVGLFITSLFHLSRSNWNYGENHVENCWMVKRNMFQDPEPFMCHCETICCDVQDLLNGEKSMSPTCFQVPAVPACIVNTRTSVFLWRIRVSFFEMLYASRFWQFHGL